MPRLNQVTLIGNLATEPFLFETRTGKPKLSFRLAVPRPPGAPRKYKSNGNGNGGDQPERADFIGITMTGPAAERHRAFLRKGSQVLVSGNLVSRDDATLTETLGRPFEVLEVWAHNLEYLSGIAWEQGQAAEEQQQHG